MESPWTIPLSLLFLTLVLALVLALAIVLLGAITKLESERVDAGHAFFVDPNSSKRITCPSIFDPAQKCMSLIIPAFNEEDRLPAALSETLSYLQQRAKRDKSFSYEVIIVDDGSKDKTYKVALDHARKYTIDNVRVILLGRNQGKGAAVKQGMLHARGELLLMLDADGATKVTDLEKLEEQILVAAKRQLCVGGDASPISSVPNMPEVSVVAFGSRAHLEKRALATRKWYRNLLMKGFHLLVLLTAGVGVRDTQCGFKMFTRAAAQKLFTNMRLRRWCFDVELVYLCKQLDIPVIEISVNWMEIPGSKVRMTSIMHMLFELMLIHSHR
ncbi:Dolichyl-phosphate beta-glucosyltransferase [Nymphaea thermarum]|nr:Dolichyl-phosphate beta-glucosyltransferase [Nymphaea thermarum]